MKRFALALTAVACVAGCGADDSASTDTTGQSGAMVRLASEIQDNTRTIGVYVFAPRDNDNIIVTCTSLLTGNPADERYNILASADFTYPGDDPDSVTIGDVKSKDPVLVYINARDSRDAVIGEGCIEDVEIEDGATVDAAVTVYAAT